MSARFSRPKAACSLPYVEYRPNTNTKKYYEKQVTLRGGHKQDRESKKMKLRM
jgi:hypothetical protein